jgi:hypothetical protein
MLDRDDDAPCRINVGRESRIASNGSGVSPSPAAAGSAIPRGVASLSPRIARTRPLPWAASHQAPSAISFLSLNQRARLIHGETRHHTIAILDSCDRPTRSNRSLDLSRIRD